MASRVANAAAKNPKSSSRPDVSVHLIKVAVGVEYVAHLAALQQARLEANDAAGLGPYPRHITRHRPKRVAELLDNGSLYWVIKGAIRARQRIHAFEEIVDADGVSRCAIVLDPNLYATHPKMHRAFQGWRYLDPAKAPADSATGEAADMPDELARALDDLGLL